MYVRGTPIASVVLVLLLTCTPAESVLIYAESMFNATEHMSLRISVSAWIANERLQSIELQKTSRTENTTILIWDMSSETMFEYRNGYTSNHISISSSDKDDLASLQRTDPRAIAFFYIFKAPRISDSGSYYIKIRTEAVDTKKPTMAQKKFTLHVQEPRGAGAEVVPVYGRLGFPLSLPCSLIAERERRESFSGVLWRKGAFLSSSKLVTQFDRATGEPRFAEQVLAANVDFGGKSREDIFELSLDASISIKSLTRSDFDTWWCEVQLNQRDTVVLYQVQVKPDDSPIFPNRTSGGGGKEPEAPTFLAEVWRFVLVPLHLYVLIGTSGAVLLVVLAACVVSCCLCRTATGPSASYNSAPVRNSQLYPMAKRMSHISIVPCEICQDNAIECFAMPCGHTYCDECLDNRINTNSACIFCRQPIQRKQRLYNRIEEHI